MYRRQDLETLWNWLPKFIFPWLSSSGICSILNATNMPAAMSWSGHPPKINQIGIPWYISFFGQMSTIKLIETILSHKSASFKSIPGWTVYHNNGLWNEFSSVTRLLPFITFAMSIAHKRNRMEIKGSISNENGSLLSKYGQSMCIKRYTIHQLQLRALEWLLFLRLQLEWHITL